MCDDGGHARARRVVISFFLTHSPPDTSRSEMIKEKENPTPAHAHTQTSNTHKHDQNRHEILTPTPIDRLVSKIYRRDQTRKKD